MNGPISLTGVVEVSYGKNPASRGQIWMAVAAGFLNAHPLKKAANGNVKGPKALAEAVQTAPPPRANVV